MLFRSGPGPKQVVYQPGVFETRDLASARSIILTAEPGTTTDERWEYETAYLADDIGRLPGIEGNSCVLDYGCGIGRVSKALIERLGCFVLGVDISAGMRELATGYVRSERFSVCSPEMLDRMIAGGFRATHACANWVLQHCAAPTIDIARIESALVPRGSIYVLNTQIGRAHV